MEQLRYTISRQTYAKVAGIPQPKTEPIECKSDMQVAAQRIVDLALDDPGVVFQITDAQCLDHFTVYAEEDEESTELVEEVLEALRRFDATVAKEAAIG